MTKLKITNRYGIVPNDLLNSKKISLRAKGLFAYLQSKPDNWTFSTDLICSQNQEGRDAVRTSLQELEEHGYLKREPKKNMEGKWAGYNYILTDQPSYWKAADGETVGRENRTTDIQEAISKKDISKKDLVKEDTSPALESINKIVLAFNQTGFANVSTLSPKRKTQLQRLISEHGESQILLAIKKAEKSDFLNNRTQGQRNWKASFDWLINQNNFIKVLEGTYDNQYRNEPGHRKLPIKV